MFGYMPLWLDMYLACRGGVDTDPATIGEPGTVLGRSTWHSQYHRTRFMFSSKLYPSPKLQVHLRRCDPTLTTSALESGYYFTQFTVVVHGK